MDTSIPVTAISGVIAIVVAAISYNLNKRQERDAEWRRLKLEHYSELVAAMSGIVGARSNEEGQARYSDAVNSMTLVAPTPVLKALYAFQNEIRYSNENRSNVRHDELLSELLRAIRRDVHPSLKSGPDLVFRLMDGPPPGTNSMATTESQ